MSYNSAILENLKQHIITNRSLTSGERKLLWDVFTGEPLQFNVVNEDVRMVAARELRHASTDTSDIMVEDYYGDNSFVKMLPKKLQCKLDESREDLFSDEKLKISAKIQAKCKKIKKKRNSLDDIPELMSQCFPGRRHYIIYKNPSVQQVKQKYPQLFNLEEFRNEIDRVFYRGKCWEFFQNLARYTTSILTVAGVTTEMVKPSLDLAKQIRDKHGDIIEVCALLMLSYLVGEGRTYLNPTDKSSMYPYIEVCGSGMQEGDPEEKLEMKLINLNLALQFKIYADGVLLCVTDSFKEAMLCYIGSYYIFYIDYKPENKKTLTVIEKILLDTTDSDECDLEPEVVEVLKKIELKRLYSVTMPARPEAPKEDWSLF